QTQNIEHVVIVGMMTHMCIDATARAAADLGYKVSVVEDACASRELTYNEHVVKAEDAHYAFISALDLLYADIYTTENFIQQQQCQLTDPFKAKIYKLKFYYLISVFIIFFIKTILYRCYSTKILALYTTISIKAYLHLLLC